MNKYINDINIHFPIWFWQFASNKGENILFAYTQPNTEILIWLKIASIFCALSSLNYRMISSEIDL